MTTPDTSDTADAVPPARVGWIVAMPDGYPYLWYQEGWKGCADSATALALFEADPQARGVLVSQGWSARPGGPAELYPLTTSERMSA